MLLSSGKEKLTSANCYYAIIICEVVIRFIQNERKNGIYSKRVIVPRWSFGEFVNDPAKKFANEKINDSFNKATLSVHYIRWIRLRSSSRK